MKIRIALLAILLANWVIVGKTCDCVVRPGGGFLLEELLSYDAVFLGIASGEAPISNERFRVVQFEVLASWRPMSHPSAAVAADVFVGSCDYSFVLGKAYLVFASFERVGTLAASICGPTARFPDQSDGALIRMLGCPPETYSAVECSEGIITSLKVPPES